MVSTQLKDRTPLGQLTLDGRLVLAAPARFVCLWPSVSDMRNAPEHARPVLIRSQINGNASRIGCATITVAAAAILTASTLRAEPLEQTTPDAVIQALQGVYGAHPGFRKNRAKGTCATGSFVGLSEATSYSRSA